MERRTRNLGAKTLIAVTASLLAGCASMAPQSTTSTYYAVWNLPARVPYQVIGRAVTTSAKERTGGASVTENPPPYPLPSAPGRFQVGQSPIGNEFAGLAEAGGGVSESGQMAYAFNNVTCPAASEMVIGKPLNVGRMHVKAVYCVYPYATGTQVDLAMMYNRTSGLDVGAMPSELAGSVSSAFGVGPRGYMRRAFTSLNNKLLELAGGSTTLVASWLPKGLSLLATSSPVTTKKAAPDESALRATVAGAP